jgi:hypothetical protein
MMSLSVPNGQGKHDPDVCGLDLPGEVPLCPGCRESHNQHRAVQSLICNEIARIARAFEDADKRYKQADTLADRETAAAERWQAAGEFHGLESELADFQLRLLRLTLAHQPDTLRLYLEEALHPKSKPQVKLTISRTTKRPRGQRRA